MPMGLVSPGSRAPPGQQDRTAARGELGRYSSGRGHKPVAIEDLGEGPVGGAGDLVAPAAVAAAQKRGSPLVDQVWLGDGQAERAQILGYRGLRDQGSRGISQ